MPSVMGQHKSKEKTALREVKEIRRSLRGSSELDSGARNELEAKLIRHSTLLSTSQRISKREKEEALRTISCTLAEAANHHRQREDDSLDLAAVESSSFVNMSQDRIARKSATVTNSSVGDVDAQLGLLKLDIVDAISKSNVKQLKYYQKQIKDLIISLELIEAGNRIGLPEKKESVEKELVLWYRKIEKAKKAANRNSNIQYLAELQDNQKIQADHLNELEKIGQMVKQKTNSNTTDDDDELINNIRAIKDDLIKYKSNAEKIPEMNNEIRLKKITIFNEIDDRMRELDNLLANQEISVGDNLTQIERDYARFKINLNSISDRENVERLRKYLIGISQYVSGICGVNSDIEKRKRSLLSDFARTLQVLNEQIGDNCCCDEEVATLRRQHRECETIDELFACWTKLKPKLAAPHPDGDLDETKRNYQILAELMQSMRQNFDDLGRIIADKAAGQSLSSIIEEDGPIKTSAKIYELPTTLKTNVAAERGETSSKGISHRKCPTADCLDEIMAIQSEVDNFGALIEDMQNTSKDDYYLFIKDQLRNCEIKLKNMQIKNDNIQISRETVLKAITSNLGRLEGKVVSTSVPIKLQNEMKILKEKVDRFTGFYKNVLYREIEKGLNHCIHTVDDQVKDPNLASDVKTELQRYLKILENKSSKSDPQNDNSNIELERVEGVVGGIALEIPELAGISGEDQKFVDLNEGLLRATLDLDRVHSNGDRTVEVRKTALVRRIQECNDVLDEKVFLTRTIHQVEIELEAIESRLESCSGRCGQQEYNDLDEILINLNVRIQKLLVDQVLAERKKMCILKIQQCQKQLNSFIKDNMAGTLV